MRDKYYTPEIEEFHIGFEYEVKGLKVWGKKTVSSSQDILEMEELMMRSLSPYRVKYLNKEDIESLGWICQMKANSVYFKKGKYRLVHWMDEPIRLVTIIEEYPGGEEAIAKKVIVKNKSEFKTLLKQLGL